MYWKHLQVNEFVEIIVFVEIEDFLLDIRRSWRTSTDFGVLETDSEICSYLGPLSTEVDWFTQCKLPSFLESCLIGC
jgi:hypothetical protein